MELKKKLRDLGASLGAAGFETGAWIFARLPERARGGALRALGRICAGFSGSMISALRTNLARLLGMSGPSLDHTAREAFQNFILTLYDFFFPTSVSIDVPERAMLETLRDRHPGLLVLTFHMGHWELGARTMQTWGWPVTAVYQPYRNARMKRVIESRRAPGVNFLAVGEGAAQGVRSALRRGDVVAMLGDLAFGEEGMPVDLLGHRVLWPKGPVLLAVREGAPIVVAVIVRTAPGRYRAIVEEPLMPERRTRAEVERLVQEVARKFGKLLTRYPTQWYRFRPLEFPPPVSKAVDATAAALSSEQR